MYYVETEGGLHQKVESHGSSPARNGKEYIYSVGAQKNNIDEQIQVVYVLQESFLEQKSV